jgi:carboxylate-amine ligase
MDHAYGATDPFLVGLEEELLLVDPARGHALADVAEWLLPRLALPEGSAGFEAYASEVELRSRPCRTAAEAVAALARGRAAVLAAGATPLGAGVHPAAAYGDARLVREERYQRVLESMRGLIQRTPECALHVHVAMPDPEAAIRACNALRAQLPLLAALSANSPFWFGRDSGLASARASLVRAYPSRGVPRAFAHFAEYERTVAATVRAAGVRDYTSLWWDVRPHPNLGTVEVREMDAQTRLEDVAALAALVQCLARAAAERPAPDMPDEAIAFSAFRASRDGTEADILGPDGELRPVRDAARATLDDLAEVAAELGATAALAHVEAIAASGGGAARQRAVHADRGMPGLLAELAAATAAAPVS